MAGGFGKDVLPHKRPMLYVGPYELSGQEVTATNKFGPMHYRSTRELDPEKVIEALAQTAAIPALLNQPDQIPVFLGIKTASFNNDRPVVNGDVLELHTEEPIKPDGDKKGRSFETYAKATIQGTGELVCHTVISGALIPSRAISLMAKGGDKFGAEPVDIFEESALDDYPAIDLDHMHAQDMLLDKASITPYRGRAIWLAGNHLYKGHFPGNPILPGIRRVGSMRQLAELHWYETVGGRSRLSGLKGITFDNAVMPDTSLRTQVETNPGVGPSQSYIGRVVKPSGAIACEGQLWLSPVD